MSSNSSNTALITNLNTATMQLNRYVSIPLLLFGIMGNLLNCLTLSQRTIRSNSCAFLFLVSSIGNLIALVSGLGLRILTGWSINISDTNDWLCKLRFFTLYVSRNTATWLITLATIDRWLSSSVNVRHRQRATLKTAKQGTILITCLSCIVFADIFYCYQANLINTPSKCYGITAWCAILTDMEFVCITVIIPSLLMLIFGFLTILNVRQASLRRVQPVQIAVADSQGINRTQQLRTIDHSLLIMLFIQVILLTIFSLPQAIQSLYSNIVVDQSSSPLAIAIHTFILTLFYILTYITNGMPFYIYTLSGGTIFRKTLMDTLKKLFQKLACQ